MKNCTADALNVKLQEFKTAVHSNKSDKKYSVTNLRSRNSSSNHSLTRFNVKTRNEVFKARQVCYIISGEETNLHPSNLPASLSISTSLCLVTKMLFDIQLFLALPDRMGKWANHLSSSTEMESAWCTVNKLRIIKTRLTPTRKTQEAFLFEKSNDLLKSDTIFKKYIPK